MKCRCVKKNNSGEVYLHRDDVTQLLIEFGATEPTDTKNRINALVINILQMKPYVEQE
jgi:hypothetical protein